MEVWQFFKYNLKKVDKSNQNQLSSYGAYAIIDHRNNEVYIWIGNNYDSTYFPRMPYSLSQLFYARKYNLFPLCIIYESHETQSFLNLFAFFIVVDDINNGNIFDLPINQSKCHISRLYHLTSYKRRHVQLNKDKNRKQEKAKAKSIENGLKIHEIDHFENKLDWVLNCKQRCRNDIFILDAAFDIFQFNCQNYQSFAKKAANAIVNKMDVIRAGKVRQIIEIDQDKMNSDLNNLKMSQFCSYFIINGKNENKYKRYNQDKCNVSDCHCDDHDCQQKQKQQKQKQQKLNTANINVNIFEIYEWNPDSFDITLVNSFSNGYEMCLFEFDSCKCYILNCIVCINSNNINSDNIDIKRKSGYNGKHDIWIWFGKDYVNKYELQHAWDVMQEFNKIWNRKDNNYQSVNKVATYHIMSQRNESKQFIKFIKGNLFPWTVERLLWIAFLKNTTNKLCKIGLLPKDLVQHLIMYLKL